MKKGVSVNLIIDKKKKVVKMDNADDVHDLNYSRPSIYAKVSERL